MFMLQGLIARIRNLEAAVAARGRWQQLSGSGTLTVPAGIYLYYLYATGGGAGGQGSYNKGTADGNSGGAGATLWRVPVFVTPGQEIAYAVGANGNGGTSSAYPTAGGNTTFGAWTAPGGDRSASASSENPSGGIIPAKWRLFGIDGDAATAAKGGDSVWGIGGNKGNTSGAPNGLPGVGYGAGGGGREYTGSGTTGGDGEPGVIYLERA